MNRLPGLDALRGIAALCVMMLHANAVFGHMPWLHRGYLGVDFFLVLSGYLMARITEPKLAAGFAPGRFMAARYRRFWGMMALGSLIGVPYLWLRAGGEWSAFLPALIANLALLPWPLAGFNFALNIPTWTIFAELVANATHVFALRQLGTKTILALWLLALGLTLWAATAWGSLDVGAKPNTALPAVPRVFLAYLTGIALWRCGGERWRVKVPGWLALPAIPLALVGAWWAGWEHWSFDLAFVLLLCPLLLLTALNIASANRFVWLSAALSFPLFAVHLPILEGMRRLGFGPLAAIPLALVVALSIVWWTNRSRAAMAAAEGAKA